MSRSPGHYYGDRVAPTVDEAIYERRLAYHLANKNHPCVAEIHAYEDATGTGTFHHTQVLAAMRRRAPKPEWSAA